jgi:putative peptidoglycan lipid II flippase
MASWTIAGAILSQLNGLLLQWAMVAARGDRSDVAGPQSQQYAFLLFMVPFSLITLSIVVALFPSMSKASQTGDLAGLRGLLRRGMVSPAVLSVPAAAALIFLGIPMLRTLYPGLDTADAHVVWPVLIGYTLCMLPQGIVLLQSRYAFAREDGLGYFSIVCVTTGAQVISELVGVFLMPAKYGVLTMACGQTIGAIIAAVIFMVRAYREVGDYGVKQVGSVWARVLGAGVAAGVIGWSVIQVLDTFGNTGWFFQVLELAISAVLFVAVYIGAAKLLQIDEVSSLLSTGITRAKSLLRR